MATVDRRPLATPEEVSEYLGVDIKTLANWRSRQEGPGFIKVGGSVRYRWSAVEKWLADNTVETF